MIPLLATAARYIGISWVAKNVIGASGVAENLLDPLVKTPPPSGGSGSFPEFYSGLFQFQIQTLAPTNADMKALDDYFESFGYNISQYREINLKVRSTFTYIKTRDAQVTAENMETVNQLTAMLNSGCKFWATEIGV